MNDDKPMPKEKAIAFFAELFQGEHHIPGGLDRIKEWGYGWQINFTPNNFATFDFNKLTTLVLMAHRDCIRAEICGSGPGMIRLVIHQRHKREGRMGERHPLISEALYWFREKHG